MSEVMIVLNVLVMGGGGGSWHKWQGSYAS